MISNNAWKQQRKVWGAGFDERKIQEVYDWTLRSRPAVKGISCRNADPTGFIHDNRGAAVLYRGTRFTGVYVLLDVYKERGEDVCSESEISEFSLSGGSKMEQHQKALGTAQRISFL